MTVRIECNGCGRVMAAEKERATAERPRLAIVGERVDGLSGAGMPNSGPEFHLCASCGILAFNMIGLYGKAVASAYNFTDGFDFRKWHDKCVTILPPLPPPSVGKATLPEE